MKDSIEIMKEVMSLIRLPEIEGSITGEIWPHSKPSGRGELTDIVVSCFTLNNKQIQTANVNINIHVPNLKDTGLPNLRRFGELAYLLLPFLDNQNKSDFYTWVENPGVIINEKDGSHFLNIVVKYNSIQSNYKNI